MKDKQQGPLIKAGYFLQEYWPQLVIFIETVLLAFSSFWFAGWANGDTYKTLGLLRLGFAYGMTLAYLGALISLVKRSDRVATLEKENRQLESLVRTFGEDVPSTWRNKLAVLNVDFGYGRTERISIYKQEGDAFIMLGRFSQNPEYDKTGRGKYPYDQGCIGKAWKEGKAFATALAAPTAKKYYDDMEKIWGIPKEVMQGLRMKSRCYAAFCLTDDACINSIGVIVFESTEPNGLDIEALEHAMKGEQGKSLVKLRKVLQPLEPSLSIAKDKGV